MENRRPELSLEDSDQEEQDTVQVPPVLITAVEPIPNQVSSKMWPVVFCHRRNNDKNARKSSQLPSTLMQLKKTQSLKELLVIAFLNEASRRLKSKEVLSRAFGNRQPKFSSISISLFSKTSPLHSSKPIVVCSSSVRRRRQEGEECRWLVNIASYIYKAKKRSCIQKRNKALESFEVLLNSKVEDIKIDVKNLGADCIDSELDPFSLSNPNPKSKQNHATRKQFFQMSYINKDIKQMAAKNPEYEHMVIDQTVNLIKNKAMQVRNGLLQIQNRIGKVSYRDFKSFYGQIKTVNTHLFNVTEILSGFFQAECNQNPRETSLGKCRIGFALKSKFQNYYQIVSISLRNVTQSYMKLQTQLIVLSSKHPNMNSRNPNSPCSAELANQKFRRFLEQASKLRYQLICLQKEITILKFKLENPELFEKQSEVQGNSKLSKTTRGLGNTHRALAARYFFKQTENDQNQRQSPLQSYIYARSQLKHVIADNRMQVRHKMQNNHSSLESIRILKQFKHMNTSIQPC